MSIITGGKQSSLPQGGVSSAIQANKVGTPNINNDNTMGSSMMPSISPVPGRSGSDINRTEMEMKDMIEVKTSNNFKLGKQTINSRLGEDYDPNKPIVNYKYPEGGPKIGTPMKKQRQQEKRDSQKPGEKPISDERLEEIKIEHYNRKIANTGS